MDELVTLVFVGAGVPGVIVRRGGAWFKSGPPPGCGVKRSIATPGAGTAVAKSESGSFTVMEVAEQAVVFDLTNELKSTTVALEPPQMIDPPLTVSEKLVVPAVTVVGLMVLIMGTGFKIVNGTAFVVPGGDVLVTVTEAAAPATNWAAGMVAVQVVAVAQLVTSDVVVPFTADFTTEPEVNPLPFTVKLVMLAAPAFAMNGEMEAMLNAPAPPRSRSQTPRP
jgi:hypothetical protein